MLDQSLSQNHATNVLKNLNRWNDYHEIQQIEK